MDHFVIISVTPPRWIGLTLDLKKIWSRPALTSGRVLYAMATAGAAENTTEKWNSIVCQQGYYNRWPL